MDKEIDIADIIYTNIQHNKEHLQNLFYELKKSNFMSDILHSDVFEKLRKEIITFEDRSMTLKSLLKTGTMDEFTIFYHNSYLKDYQNVIATLTLLQKEKAQQFKIILNSF